RHACTFAAAYMAVARCGGVCVPMSTRLTPPEVRAFSAYVGARWAITDQDAFPETTGIHRVWGLDDAPRGDPSMAPPALGRDDICDIIPTSGTTGAPKGVVSTHGDLLQQLGDGSGGSPFATMLHALPLTGSGGCHAIMMLPLRAGVTLLTQPSFDP